jgi:hypothetical protein
VKTARRIGPLAGFGVGLWLLLIPAVVWPQDDAQIFFAVVTKISKDTRQVSAHVLAGNAVSEAALLPSESIADNLIWRKLEVCHSLRFEGAKTPDGYRLTSVKSVDAGMLPMALQGIAGDCLMKKALEFAPAID